jgi:hypothetical protein
MGTITEVTIRTGTIAVRWALRLSIVSITRISTTSTISITSTVMADFTASMAMVGSTVAFMVVIAELATN